MKPVLAALLLALVAASAVAAAPAADPAPTLKLLTPVQADFKRLIGPPPARGSAVEAAELAETRRLFTTTDPVRKAAAQWDNDHEDSSIWGSLLGLDPGALPLTGALLSDVINDQEISTDAAKAYFARTRPWALDTSMVPCDAAPAKKTNTSYPSGHAAIGFSTGVVLAWMLPEKAETIMARANDYAFSREICADHFVSDIEASHALANAIASEILTAPALQPRLTAARAELRARLGLP